MQIRNTSGADVRVDAGMEVTGGLRHGVESRALSGACLRIQPIGNPVPDQTQSSTPRQRRRSTRASRSTDADTSAIWESELGEIMNAMCTRSPSPRVARF